MQATEYILDMLTVCKYKFNNNKYNEINTNFVLEFQAYKFSIFPGIKRLNKLFMKYLIFCNIRFYAFNVLI